MEVDQPAPTDDRISLSDEVAQKAQQTFESALERVKPVANAIEKPAHQLGVQLEDGLTVRLLDAVSEAPGNLPLLEFALSLLWGRQSNGKLTHLAYDQIGGVEKALASYAEEVFNGFTYAQQQQAQRVFIQLVRPGEGSADNSLSLRD